MAEIWLIGRCQLCLSYCFYVPQNNQVKARVRVLISLKTFLVEGLMNRLIIRGWNLCSGLEADVDCHLRRRSAFVIRPSIKAMRCVS
ncbi:hypothetical protein TNCV_4368841 [Trichonephila clavipes]|nr:hypothetical protein TNCV_4368841 [Trichonephila clavipes]